MFFPVKYLPGGSAIPEKTASQLSFVKVIVVGKPGKRVLLPGGASDSASLFAHFPEKHLRKKWCKNVTSALVVVYLQQLNTYKKKHGDNVWFSVFFSSCSIPPWKTFSLSPKLALAVAAREEEGGGGGGGWAEEEEEEEGGRSEEDGLASSTLPPTTVLLLLLLDCLLFSCCCCWSCCWSCCRCSAALKTVIYC